MRILHVFIHVLKEQMNKISTFFFLFRSFSSIFASFHCIYFFYQKFKGGGAPTLILSIVFVSISNLNIQREFNLICTIYITCNLDATQT